MGDIADTKVVRKECHHHAQTGNRHRKKVGVGQFSCHSHFAKIGKGHSSKGRGKGQKDADVSDSINHCNGVYFPLNLFK